MSSDEKKIEITDTKWDFTGYYLEYIDKLRFG